MFLKNMEFLLLYTPPLWGAPVMTMATSTEAVKDQVSENHLYQKPAFRDLRLAETRIGPAQSLYRAGPTQ
jgi:hypothetical protein